VSVTSVRHCTNSKNNKPLIQAKGLQRNPLRAFYLSGLGVY
jgi:hypothetical protein